MGTRLVGSRRGDRTRWALASSHRVAISKTNPPWNFSVPWEVNIALGRKPLPQDLAAGRRLSAILITITAVALIAVSCTFVATPWAIAAGALFAVRPFTVYIGSIAATDALFGLLILLPA